MTPKFVIASTGHSGSGYIAKVLQAYNINCGHEGYYRFPWKKPRGKFVGDSTWHIVPLLENYEGIVFHQVRDPLNVLNSLYLTFKDSDSRAWTYRSQLVPNPTGDRLRDIMQMIVYMNSKIDKYAKIWWQLEHVCIEDIKMICMFTGLQWNKDKAEKAIQSVSEDYNNHHDNSEYFGWDDIPDSAEKEAIIKQANQYGYSYDNCVQL